MKRTNLWLLAISFLLFLSARPAKADVGPTLDCGPAIVTACVGDTAQFVVKASSTFPFGIPNGPFTLPITIRSNSVVVAVVSAPAIPASSPVIPGATPFVATFTYTVTGPGTYSATVQDLTGTATCTRLFNFLPRPTVTVNNATNCVGGGSVTLTAVVQNATSILWNTGATTASITVNPGASTDYFVTVGNGLCTAKATAHVEILPQPTVTVNNGTNCVGGSVTLTADAQNATSFLWSTGETTPSISVKPDASTDYSVTVGNGYCEAKATAHVEIIPVPTVTVNDGTNCLGGSVTLTATVGGATSILWSTGETTPSISVSPASTSDYTVTVSNGYCDAKATAHVEILPVPTVTVNDGTNCVGGSVILTATVGNATSILWSTGETTPSITVNPGASTDYTVTVGNGYCEAKATAHVEILPVPTVTVNNGTNCVGGNVILTATVGNATSILWSTGEMTPSITVNPGASTDYTVTVGNGYCEAKATAHVEILPVPTVTVNNGTNCVGGSVVLTATVGNATSILWSTGETTPSISVHPGASTDYTVTVGNGYCEAKATAHVEILPVPTVTVNNGTNCVGGSVILTATVGNATSILWSTGETTPSISVHPGASTDYTVTVGNGYCEAKATAHVEILPVPTVTVNNGTNCVGGSVVLTATVGNATSILWSTGEMTPSITVNPGASTDYTVTVGNGYCEAKATAHVEILPVPTVTVNNGTNCVGGNVILTATVGNATSILWSTGETTPSISVHPGASTDYTVTVGNGYCEAKATAHVEILPVPTVTVNNGTNCVGGNVTLTAIATGGTIKWSTGETTASITVNPAASTDYTVTVSNGYCDAKATAHVEILPVPTVTVNNGTNCVGGNVTLTAIATGGTIKWSTGATTASITVNPAASTDYTVTVSNGYCDAKATAHVEILPVPTVTVNNGTNCVGGNVTLTAIATGGTIKWSTGATTASITVNPAASTDYTVTVSNGYCEAKATAHVEIYPQLSVVVNGGKTLCPPNTTPVTLNAVVTPGGSYTYSWSSVPAGASGSSASITVTPTVTTVYTVKVTSPGGCSATSQATITVEDKTPPVVTCPPDKVLQNSGGTCQQYFFCSYTPGGWGAVPQGNNPGMLLYLNFNKVFPSGYVEIGIPGAGGYSAKFTSQLAIQNYLPDGSTPGKFTSDTLNPVTTPAGVFGSHVLAATLNVAFSAAGITPNVSGPLGTLVYNNPSSPLNGKTVSQILAIANTVIGGGALPAGVTYSSLTDLLSSFNQGFDNCTTTGWAKSFLLPTCTVLDTTPGATGYPTVTDSCDSTPTISYTDTTVQTSCGGYIITRTWTAKDDSGNVGTCTQKITVNGNTAPTVTVNSGFICNGGSITLTATGATGAVFYQWSNGQTGPSITVSPTATTTYTVTVTLNGGCTASASGTVTVGAAPTVTVSVPPVSCAGSPVTLTAVGSAGVSYLWNTGATTPSITVSPLVTTTYTVTVKSASGGCTDSEQVTVTVGDTTPPVIICPPDVVVKGGIGSRFYCSYTPGGWGAPPNGNNVGSLLANNFTAVYPGKLVEVGVVGSGGYSIKLTSALAIQNFLPSGGTPSKLTGDLSNPLSSPAGEFASQVLALKLNVDFSAAGLTPGGANPLGSLVYDEPGSPIDGATVSQVLALANLALGGGDVSVYGMSISTLMPLLTSMNQGFDNCTATGWAVQHLLPPVQCPASGTPTVTDNCDPNPVVTYTDTTSEDACTGATITYRKWKATDAKGNSSYCTQKITLQPSTGVLAINVSSYTSGGAVTLTATGVTGLSYLWSNGATTPSITVTPTTTANYTVTVSLAGGCTVSSTVTVGPPPYPSPWNSKDIGVCGATGSSKLVSGVFTVNGGGSDISGTSDSFQYIYQSGSGDCTIVAKVTGVENTDPWAKAGVMIRESLNPDARHASVFVTPGNGVAFQSRSATAGTSTSSNTTGLAAPYWVKIMRSGSTFTAYRSADGVTWTSMGSRTISMGSTCYIGLAVTAHNSATLCTATFSNVTATP